MGSTKTGGTNGEKRGKNKIFYKIELRRVVKMELSNQCTIYIFIINFLCGMQNWFNCVLSFLTVQTLIRDCQVIRETKENQISELKKICEQSTEFLNNDWEKKVSYIK